MGDPSTNRPKSMFQLSGVHYRSEPGAEAATVPEHAGAHNGEEHGRWCRLAGAGLGFRV